MLRLASKANQTVSNPGVRREDLVALVEVEGVVGGPVLHPGQGDGVALLLPVGQPRQDPVLGNNILNKSRALPGLRNPALYLPLALLVPVPPALLLGPQGVVAVPRALVLAVLDVPLVVGAPPDPVDAGDVQHPRQHPPGW